MHKQQMVMLQVCFKILSSCTVVLGVCWISHEHPLWQIFLGVAPNWLSLFATCTLLNLMTEKCWDLAILCYVGNSRIRKSVNELENSNVAHSDAAIALENENEANITMFHHVDDWRDADAGRRRGSTVDYQYKILKWAFGYQSYALLVNFCIQYCN